MIAVPTSLGYRASFGGATVLQAMLNSCATDLTPAISPVLSTIC